VLGAMRNVARMGLLRCVASRSIDYVELLAWLVHNLVALFEINQDAPVLGHALARLNTLREDMATFNEYKVVPVKDAVAFLNKLFRTDCINFTSVRSATAPATLYVNGVAFMVNTFILSGPAENRTYKHMINSTLPMWLFR